MSEQIHKKNWLQVGSVVIIFLLITEVFFLIVQNRELKALCVEKQTETLKPGDHAGRYTMRTTDGRLVEMTYTDMKKKYLLFIFSATCPHCQKTIPIWQDIALKNKNTSLDIIGVSLSPPDTTKK